MPPKKKLPEAVIANLTRWIANGAFFPDGDQTGQTAAQTSTRPKLWSFQPLRGIEPPSQQTAAGVVSNAIDCFIGAKLSDNGLYFAPRAGRRMLIRRAAFDLTGLPPTPEAVDRFLSDARPDAFERLVDQLLASPRYGERWGRWWLDIARYADSNGQDEN
jgi:hypothetical protein